MSSDCQHPEAPLWWVSHGFGVFRCKGKIPDARFAPHGKDDATTDLEEVEGWPAGVNYGIVPRPGTFVVDVDQREALRALEALHGDLPVTLTVETGSGGLHLWFAGDVPQYQHPKKCPGCDDPRHGLDTRAAGKGYVVGPGSVHPDTGKPYRVLLEEDIAEAPAWLVALYASKGKATGQGDFTSPDWKPPPSSGGIPVGTPPPGARSARVDASTRAARDARSSVAGDAWDRGGGGSDYPTRIVRKAEKIGQRVAERTGEGQGGRDALLKGAGVLGGNIAFHQAEAVRGKVEAILLAACGEAAGRWKAAKAIADAIADGMKKPTPLGERDRDPDPSSGARSESEGDSRPEPPPIDEPDPGGEAPPPEPDIMAFVRIDRTDLGNAKRLRLRFGEDLRWSQERDGWYAWVGTHWAWDLRRLAHNWSQRTVEKLRLELDYWQDQLALCPSDQKSRKTWLENQVKQAAGHLLASQSSGRIAACHGEARGLPGMAIAIQDLDRDPMALCTPTGTVDLETGACRPHRRVDLITKITGVPYDLRAPCPRWDRFVRNILPDDEVRGFLQRFLGYSLTGIVNEQIWVVFKGEGSNGKSTLIELVRFVVGSYGFTVPRTVLEQQQFEHHPTELMGFAGARFAAGVEPKKNGRWDAERIKMLTGDDKIVARAMNKDFVEFPPSHHLVVACNGMPGSDDDSHGFWRRMVMIPFDVQYRRADEPVTGPEDNRPLADPNLKNELLTEGPGILRWMLDGLAEWKRRGLRIPDACRVAVREYRDEQNPVKSFVDEECELSPMYTAETAALYAAYCRWHASSGLRGKPREKNVFSRLLGDTPGVVHHRGATRGVVGLKLRVVQ